MRINLAKVQKYRMYLGKCPHCDKRLHLEQDINLMEPNTIGESEESMIKNISSEESVINEK